MAQRNKRIAKFMAIDKTIEFIGTQEYRMCAEKTKFESERIAQKKANEYGMRCYKCHYCKKWHLTSSKE